MHGRWAAPPTAIDPPAGSRPCSTSTRNPGADRNDVERTSDRGTNGTSTQAPRILRRAIVRSLFSLERPGNSLLFAHTDGSCVDHEARARARGRTPAPSRTGRWPDPRDPRDGSTPAARHGGTRPSGAAQPPRSGRQIALVLEVNDAGEPAVYVGHPDHGTTVAISRRAVDLWAGRNVVASLRAAEEERRLELCDAAGRTAIGLPGE